MSSPSSHPCTIYKIFSPQNPSIVYIGSTSRPLKQRLCEHVSNYKKTQCGLLTSATSRAFKIFEMFEPENCQIKAIDYCTHEDRHKREQIHIDNNPTCVNKNKAYIPNKEEHRRNYIKIYMRDYMPTYYKNNIEQKRQYYRTRKQWKQEIERLHHILLD